MKKNLYFKLLIFLFLFIFLSPLSLIAHALCTGDLNGDLQVNYSDLVIFAMAYRATPGDANWNPVCDLNTDGSVNYSDLVIFAMHYRDDCEVTEIFRRALLVGVGDYLYGDNDLSAPPYDVDKMHDTLSHSGEGFAIINELKNLNATKSAILNGIASTFSEADADDISYFYFSGHGATLDNISYLIPTDFNVYTNTCISVSELESALSAIPGTKVVFLDSCHSGGFIGKELNQVDISTNLKSFNANLINTFMINSLSKDLANSQYQVLTACHSTQYSFEILPSGYDPYGVFTDILCQGCGYDYYSHPYYADENENGEITLNEVYVYTNIITDLYFESLDQDAQIYPENSDFVIIEE